MVAALAVVADATLSNLNLKLKKGKKNTVVEERGERGRMHSTNRSVFFFKKK
jgi:hypothetical protein